MNRRKSFLSKIRLFITSNFFNPSFVSSAWANIHFSPPLKIIKASRESFRILPLHFTTFCADFNICLAPISTCLTLFEIESGGVIFSTSLLKPLPGTAYRVQRKKKSAFCVFPLQTSGGLGEQVMLVALHSHKHTHTHTHTHTHSHAHRERERAPQYMQLPFVTNDWLRLTTRAQNKQQLPSERNFSACVCVCVYSMISLAIVQKLAMRRFKGEIRLKLL